jgi:hypothetical protein
MIRVGEEVEFEALKFRSSNVRAPPQITRHLADSVISTELSVSTTTIK